MLFLFESPIKTMEAAVIAEAKVKTDDGEIFYASISEFEGTPMFFKVDRSTFDEQLDDASFTDEFIEFMNSHSLGFGDYQEFYTDQKDHELYLVFKCLAHVVRADWNECRPFMEMIKGKYVNEIYIPTTDIEEEMLE